ncbi:MAG: rhamnogalacturonan lyase [Prevotella sp.]|nr:rhamnogalacturonan lyase [Prevotella sp.]
MEHLDRGLIALPASGSGMFVSWRSLGYDAPATTFNLLRDGETVVTDLFATNYTDAGGRTSSKYQIVTLVDGSPVDTTDVVTPWTQHYKKLVLQRPAKGANGGTYDPNDCSVGDVDGDGEYEIFVKWNPSNAKDNSQGGVTDNVFIDCYKLSGTLLWRIDLGPNIRAGAHYTQFMVYDFDGDGRAEMMLKTAPGTKDGKGNYVNQKATEDVIRNASNSTIYRNGDGKITGGQEWLTVFNGETGEAIHTIFYNPNRDAGYGGEARGSFNWDDRNGRTDYASYGNRGERYLAAVAHLDGPDKAASGIFSRGYYTYAYIWAVDFDGQHLKQKWFSAHAAKNSYRLTTFDADGNGTTKTLAGKTPTSGGGSGTMYGNGNHNLSVADVDGDGRDEIIWGAAALDHDGTLLYATGFGHGDAMHLADHNPERPGLELYQVHEEKGTYAWDLHDAKTGEVLLKGGPAGIDNGRGIAGHFDARVHASLFWSSDKMARSALTGEAISDKVGSTNFRIYWDGDLQEELLDGNKLDKWNGSGTTRLVTFGDLGPSSTCNGSKNTPCLSADILGDWREEVILYRASDLETCLAIYSTDIPTVYRVPTLMHDHTYRMGVCWQNVAYNQPPHLGYYLPDLNMPTMTDNGRRFVVKEDEQVEWTFATKDVKNIEYNGYTVAGEKHDGLPRDIAYTIEGEENPTLSVKGTFHEAGNYTFNFILTGIHGDRVPVGFSVTCRSNSTEQATGVLRKWDFTNWSQQTMDNLIADAEMGDETGWSDVEYLNKMEAANNRCFWLQDNQAGEVKANGVPISELRGLMFSDAYCQGRSLAIAVDYGSTDIGTYAGKQYLWLGIGNNPPYCFYIPDVIEGTDITMSVESHRNGQGRGVGIYAMSDNGSLVRIGDNYTPDALGTYTWSGWTLPDGVSDTGGKVDIYVKNTSGCHIYTIAAVVSDSDIPSLVDNHVLSQDGSSSVYNINGQRLRVGASAGMRLRVGASAGMSVHHLKKGVYIVDRKKVVIR